MGTSLKHPHQRSKKCWPSDEQATDSSGAVSRNQRHTFTHTQETHTHTQTHTGTQAPAHEHAKIVCWLLGHAPMFATTGRKVVAYLDPVCQVYQMACPMLSGL